MKQVMFRFVPGLPSARLEEAVRRIRDIPGVNNAAPLMPNAFLEDMRRDWFLYVDDETDAAAVLDAVQSLKEVQQAEMPAPRTLVF